MMRLLLVPVFFLTLYYYLRGYEMMLWWARGSLILIILSDFFDGYLARLWRETSTLGSLLDPLADKLFVTAVYVLLAVYRQVPPWLVIIVVAKDIMVVMGWTCMAIVFNRTDVRPSWWGKGATALQFATVCCVIFFPMEFYAPWAFYATGGVTLVALLHYGYMMLLETSGEPDPRDHA